MADTDPLQRAKRAKAQSKALQERVARAAEAIAQTEAESADLHHRLADQGGPLAEAARDHAVRAEELAAKERAEAERLRRSEPD